MGVESRFSPDQGGFKVIKDCQNISAQEVESGGWGLEFLFDQDNTSEWNRAADLAVATDRSQWELAIGPNPTDPTKSAIYKRILDPTGQLTLGN